MKKTDNSYFWSFISFRVIIHLLLHACSALCYPGLAGVPGQCPLTDGISNINDEKERSLLALASCSVESLKVCKWLEGDRGYWYSLSSGSGLRLLRRIKPAMCCAWPVSQESFGSSPLQAPHLFLWCSSSSCNRSSHSCSSSYNNKLL